MMDSTPLITIVTLLVIGYMTLDALGKLLILFTWFKKRLIDDARELREAMADSIKRMKDL